ncbi:MAG: hypothetical protein ACT4NU_11555 [Chromatiales bacterium]
MADTIRGRVLRIVDGGRFDMEVRYVSSSNRHTYRPVERVRLANVDAPRLDTQAGQSRRTILAARLSGREVRCFVHDRDIDEQIIATVTIVNGGLEQRMAG